MPVQKRTNTARINDIGAWTGTMVEVIAAESHLDEAARVEALRALGVLDTQPEERFDRITRLATVLLDVPISLVSLVDDRRQWSSRMADSRLRRPRRTSRSAPTPS